MMNRIFASNGMRRAAPPLPVRAFLRQGITLFALAAFLFPALFLSACAKKAERHYSLQGKVVSVDSAQGILEIDEDEIPGYMAAMKMSYAVAHPDELRGLQPGDIVKAELVFPNGLAKLEKVTLVQKGAPVAPLPAPAPEKKE
jgi:Cu/Ag efflux protein CusF